MVNLTDLTTEESRRTALDSTGRLGDFKYHSTSDLDGLTPEETEEHQRIAEEIELVACYNDQIERSERRTRIKNPKNYDRLLKACRALEVNVEKPSSDDVTTMRRQLINIMGYSKLIANHGEKVLTCDARPERVIEVYKDCIQRAKGIQLD